MATPETHFDIIIVGGGLVGNTLAYALRASGLRIALVESMTREQQFQAPQGDRALALSAGTVAALEALKLWQGIQDEATPISEIHVSDRGHFGKTRLSATKEKVPALGYVITARAIEHHVGNLLGHSAIRQFAPARVSALSSDEQSAKVTVDFADSTLELSASLVIGADGGNSSIRGLAGITQRIWDYGQTALVTTVKTSLPHHNTAYERFTESGPLALLPLGSKHCAVVWTRRHADAASLMEGTDKAFLTELQHCFGYRLGALMLAAERRAFPVALIRAERMHSGRTLIIGNAAHQLHPVAGQGFNLGLRDVMQFAEMAVHQIASGGDVGESNFLRNFARARQQDHHQTITFTDSLIKLFSSRSLLVAATRNMGMTLLDHAPFGKSVLARHAMGLAQQGKFRT